MKEIANPKLKKRKFLREDGRDLIYFTFHHEGPPRGEDEMQTGSDVLGSHNVAKPENGERRQ